MVFPGRVSEKQIGLALFHAGCGTALCVFLVACGNPLGQVSSTDTNFTPGIPYTGASPAPSPAAPALPFHFSQGLKIGPGAVSSIGARTAASVAVTITQRTATGAHTSGVFSLNQFQSR